jgi:hypothetical protein
LFRLRTSGSIASGDLKLGLGRYGVISAFGRKEVGNFSFNPSLVGNFNETIVVENVLDSFNDQNVSVKAAVRKQPTFSVDPATLDFGIIDTANSSRAAPQSFVVTNASKGERTFVVEVTPSKGSFAEVTLSRDEGDAGTALSKAEEEEAEGLLQKLKIARRKGKTDKVAKYEARLSELGVPFSADVEESSEASDERQPEAEAAPNGGKGDPYPGPESAVMTTTCTTLLSFTLQPNQKAKVFAELLLKPPGGGPLASTIRVYEKKNTDETVGLFVTASPKALSSVTQSSNAANTSNGE